ncbi:MAG: selenide, water dikinase SelD [Rhodobacteraceae bacterium]|nr:selenide, water dikinase SelD [Paracoccaceae bacterium]
MQSPSLPLTRDLVLIGGGHAHALVLRQWGMNPLAGARVTVINPGPTAPYSGMLPGFVAGHYTRDALDIDLVKLARFANARVVVGSAEGIDLDRREVHVPGRPPIAFDVASVDVGITSDMPALPGFADHAIPAKPLGRFAAEWQSFRDGDAAGDVAVIGGGVAGVELILAMAFALRTRGRLRQATLIDNAQTLTAIGPKARQRLLDAMQKQGVTVLEHAEITEIGAESILLADGREVPSRFTTGAAGARPYDWIRDTGLQLQDGFITVNETLQSSDPMIFAAGDCAHLSASPRPKAGVYAVRQAPILYNNFRAALGSGTLRPYKAQKDYLKLISLGEKSALGERFGATFAGPMIWKWKDRIDQTFMQKFRDLPKMEAAPLPSHHAAGLAEAVGDKPMCGGCGSKVGRNALRDAFVQDRVGSRKDVEFLPGDDAAVLRHGEIRQVLSTDHLRAFTLDPVVMTRIAAVHALGDVWAMGAAPQAALASLTLPRMSPALQQRSLSEIMTVAHEVFREAGAGIVGGHTTLGDELTIGFAVTGLCETDPITLAGALAGDLLILTKPIGSGVLMAAEMQGAAQGEWIAAALEQMTRPQSEAARILSSAHAMTDVTGFGLAGHLMGISEASNLRAHLRIADIPVLQGAEELAQSGVRSTLFPENRLLAPELPEGGKHDLLFDPQTAGGLLACVAKDEAETLLSQLSTAGYNAAIIGEMSAGAPGIDLA